MTEPTKSTFARRIRAPKPREKRYRIRDDVIKGLCLRVYPSGTRNFVLDRMTRGRRHYASIGSAEAMSVPQARCEARALIAAFTDTVNKSDGPMLFSPK